MPSTSTRFFSRPDGRLAWDEHGSGPLVVCLPGLGDLRAEYRFLTPYLVDAGYRVITVDLRGHGESDTTFHDHERPTVGDDLVALLEDLDAGPAHLIGTSFGASAVVWAAAERPERVASATLIGPFVLDRPPSLVERLGLRVLLARPWGVAGWMGWYGKLWGEVRPPDHEEYRERLRRNLREPGRMDAVRAMARSDTRRIDPRLDDIRRDTTLVVMGTADPDFADPAAVASEIAHRTGGRVAMIDGAGHYPHAEAPERVGVEVREFLARMDRRVGTGERVSQQESAPDARVPGKEQGVTDDG